MSITANQTPAGDGAVTLYGPQASNRRLIYVNGINTSPQAHRETAAALSGILQAQVLGVYNASDGIGRDLEECADEYADLVKDVLMNAGKRASAEVIRLGSRALSSVPPLQFLKYAGDVAATSLDMLPLPPSTDYLTNPATYALWNLLAHHTRHWPHLAISIVAHSQGNLITSSALFLHEYSTITKGIGTKRAIHVYALASPSPAWPRSPHVSVRTYSYADDIVPYLSMGRSFGGVVGVSSARPLDPLAAHDVLGYVRNSRLFRDLALDLGIVGVDGPLRMKHHYA
jgi:hypothetical protein